MTFTLFQIITSVGCLVCVSFCVGMARASVADPLYKPNDRYPHGQAHFAAYLFGAFAVALALLAWSNP